MRIAFFGGSLKIKIFSLDSFGNIVSSPGWTLIGVEKENNRPYYTDGSKTLLYGGYVGGSHNCGSATPSYYWAVVAKVWDTEVNPGCIEFNDALLDNSIGVFATELVEDPTMASCMASTATISNCIPGLFYSRAELISLIYNSHSIANTKSSLEELVTLTFKPFKGVNLVSITFKSCP